MFMFLREYGFGHSTTVEPRLELTQKRFSFDAATLRLAGFGTSEQLFMAILGDQDVGIFVSTGGFTSDAEMEARTKETRKRTLTDLRKLMDLWIEYLPQDFRARQAAVAAQAYPLPCTD